MTVNVGNKMALLTVEVAHAVMTYKTFMDANAGAYTYEQALRASDRKEVPGEPTISGAIIKVP